jgi:hypothetical protein
MKITFIKKIGVLQLLPTLYCLATIALLIPVTVNAWQWGSEGNQACPYTEPTELLGCKWFNFSNGWVENTPSKFQGWNTEVKVFPLCFQGSVASVMLYYSWPMETHTTGYLNCGDATGGNQGSTQNCRLTRIDHVWNYSGINNFSSCQADDPATRSLNNCSITGYCTAAHEISRLYAAVKIGCNYNTLKDDYGSFFNVGPQGFCEILKSRLGFTGAQYVLCSDSRMPDIVSQAISNYQPVIAYTSGHVWVIDGYRNYGTPQVHQLNYHNNCSHHTAEWVDLTPNLAFAIIYNLNPTREIQPSATLAIDYTMGNSYVPNTSNTSRKASIFISGCGFGTESFQISATSTQYLNGTWGNPVTVLSPTTYTVGCGTIVTPEFGYTVPASPNDAIKITVTIDNQQQWYVYPRVQILESQVEDKMPIKVSNSEIGAIAHNGSLELKKGIDKTSPITGSGLCLNAGGVTKARWDADGALHSTDVQETQTDWFNAPTSDWSGGLLFNNIETGIPNPCLHITTAGTIRTKNKVQSPAGFFVPAELWITGPNVQFLSAGQPVNITWDYNPALINYTAVTVSVSSDRGRTWRLVVNQGIPVEARLYTWTVESQYIDKLILFKVQGYGTSRYAQTDNPIKVAP